jgi:TRAP-type C4-dicarboxylate transport system permease small subunit
MASMLKAILAGLIAAGGSVVTGLGDNTLSAQEIVTAVVVGLVALGSVYGVSNVPKAGS